MSIIIQTERLNLKKIEQKDLNQLIKNLNNWNIVKWLVNVPYPYTINDAKNWMDKTIKEELTLNIYLNNTLIGGITIDSRSEDNKNVLGYWLVEEHWGKGYALESSKSLISYFFSNYSEKKIIASHMADNEKSKKILISLGFKKINTSTVFSLSRNENVKDINYELIKS